ncbi:phosphoenolpyruvate hydrolase family protein [Bradyrhizobium erythrophlei]|uniref:phosphoenolpyruvate hydrolase family protein n=1 Tax=Bradyrhizobium erythrophlei TaxID=1437360 RepID=UPI0035EBD82C
MSRRFKRTEVLDRLNKQIGASRSILVVGAGNGLVARCAEDAGADIIVVYNSGYFRLNGHPSMLGNLPIGNANEIMLELGGRSVIPVTRDVPVVGGVYGVDPTRDMGLLFEDMRRAGFSGVINFPTVGRIDGQYRRDLEAAGLGFAREVEMIRRARAEDMLTMSYVYTPEDAVRMVEAGCDLIVGHCGLTAGGDVGSTNAMALEKAFNVLNGIFDAVRKVNPNVVLLSHGGPLSSMADAELANLKTGAVGFVAASSIERIPIEQALKDACRGFKGIKVADAGARLRA